MDALRNSAIVLVKRLSPSNFYIDNIRAVRVTGLPLFFDLSISTFTDRIVSTSSSASTANPAIVAQNAVRRLPRWVLWALCLAYVLPGFLGRTPWKSEDMESFGYMLHLAQALGPESVSWLQPSLIGQVEPQGALLPYWLGAWSIQIFSNFLAPDLAARIPFIALLGFTLLATWYAVYALARTPAAQPLAFAFGGEARPADYARAVADGGLLAFLACLGLARLSHETSPALAQLCFCAMLFCALANLTRQRNKALLFCSVSILGLALSGAPALAMILGVGGSLLIGLQTNPSAAIRVKRLDVAWILLTCLMTAALVSALGLWRWRVAYARLFDFESMARLLLWFTWPAWPLSLWTLWRWRHQLQQTSANLHLSLPIGFTVVAIMTTWLSGLSDRALLLSLPAMAALAAFALPTLQRSVSALIDWFTLLFFSTCAIVIWVVWLSMQTGWPAQPAINVARIAPGFTATFSALLFGCALLATSAWAFLVKWRAGRHRPALWKSMALPAGGATLCWLLIMTLWLPLLDFGRSYAPLVNKVQSLMGDTHCVHYFGLRRAQGAAFEFHGHLKLIPTPTIQAAQTIDAQCPWLIVDTQALNALPQEVDMRLWTAHATVKRPSDNNENIVLYRRRELP